MSSYEIQARRDRAGRTRLDALESESAAEQYNTSLRQRLNRIIGSLSLILDGDTVAETQLRDNLFNLAGGDHGGAILGAIDTIVCGVGAGATMSRPVTCEKDAVVDGVVFSMDGAFSSPSVTVRVGAVVIFRNCIFERPGDDAQSHVLVEETGKATFVGCVFRGSTVTASPVVSHSVAGPGLGSDVQIAYSYNNTGNTLFAAGTAVGTGNH